MRHTHTIGVDVSDSSIKVLELDTQGHVIAYGTAALAENVVHNGNILNKEAFAETLIEILEHTKPTVLRHEGHLLRAVLCLPETKLFTHFLTVPPSVLKNQEEEYIKHDAETIIPFALDELYWDYHVTRKEGGERKAVFVGVPKADLDSYVEAFSFARIVPSFVGSQLFSLGRSLLPNSEFSTGYFIADIGAHTTTLGAFSSDAIADMSIVIPKGGDFFTRVIADELGMSMSDAEAAKRKYGVVHDGAKSRVPLVLREHLESVIDKVIEAKKYFELKTGNEVRTLVLSGGSSLMPGLREYFEEKSGISCILADPFAHIQNQTVFGTDTPGVLFATVIGLALHANSQLRSINLLSLYRFQEGELRKEKLDIREIRTANDLQYFMFTYAKLLQQFFKNIRFKPALNRHALQVAGSFIFLFLTLTFLAWVIVTYM